MFLFFFLYVRHRREKRFYLSLHIVTAKSQIEKSCLDCICLSVLIHIFFPPCLLCLVSLVCFSWQSQTQCYIYIYIILYSNSWKVKMSPCCHNTTQKLICYTLARSTMLPVVAELEDNLWDIWRKWSSVISSYWSWVNSFPGASLLAAMWACFLALVTLILFIHWTSKLEVGIRESQNFANQIMLKTKPKQFEI